MGRDVCAVHALARRAADLDVAVDLVQSSCGFAVPYFDYAGDREMLAEWAQKKGPAGIRQYWIERNRQSLDGMPTHIEKSGAKD